MSPDRSALHRVRRGYRAAAVIVLNTIVALLVLQGALALLFRTTDRSAVGDDIYAPVTAEQMATLYPDHSRAEVMDLWRESVKPLAYQPFTEFAERPRTGAFVNVHPAGFRRIAEQGPWPPDARRTNVFVFGGSTTFGYGLADGDTIASHLQGLLRAHDADVSVYNFGRGYYYSTQERILFEQLLAAGHVPAVAIFIDGLNDLCYERDETEVSRRLVAAIEAGAHGSIVDWIAATPIGRAVDVVRARIGAATAANDADPDEGAMRRMIDRYRANMRLIEATSGAHGVVPIFVWQPVPVYRYDTRFHLFADRPFGAASRVRRGYELMADTVRAHPNDDRFLWLADVQEESRDALYVDVVHYTPRFSARIAALIDGRIGPLIREARDGR